MSETDQTPKIETQRVLEADIAETLVDKRGNREKIFEIDGVVSPKTLKNLADKLDYEVSVVVSADLTSTHFLPGEETHATDENGLIAMGLRERASDSHNHPFDVARPSLADLISHQGSNPTFILATSNVIEYRYNLPDTPLAALHNYVSEYEDVNFLPEGITMESMRQKALTILSEEPGFEELSEDQKEREIGYEAAAYKYRYFKEYYYANTRNEDFGNLTVRFFKHYDLMHEIAWDDEETISRLLRGESTFED